MTIWKMLTRKTAHFYLSIFVFLTSVSALAELSEPFLSWNKPVAPFRIIGNIYYVGVEGVCAYLVTTSQGHILIDGAFAESTPLIEKSIIDLGFKLEDVKILLAGHAHFDHAGSLAELKRATGGELITSAPEAEMLARGGKGDFHYGDKLPFQPVKADRIVKDKEQIRLGDVVVTAYLTPGHTKGCMTWTMKTTQDGKTYDVVFIGSLSTPGYSLIGNKNYPNIAEDCEYSFKFLKTLPCDVFLAQHGFYCGLKEKMAKRDEKTNPFIDPDGYRKAIDRAKQNFEKQLAAKRSRILNVPPERPVPSDKFLFYLHGAIVEGSDGCPESSDYGPYEYRKIIEQFAGDGFYVISEIRPADTKPELYADKVVGWIDQLLRSGVPAGNISVVGASKGGVIAVYVSSRVCQRDVRYVILAGLFKDMESEKNLKLHGRVLSIHDASDKFAVSPDDYFRQSPDLCEGKSIVTQTGLGHGLLYRPCSEWYLPTVAWLSKNPDEEQKKKADK